MYPEQIKERNSLLNIVEGTVQLNRVGVRIFKLDPLKKKLCRQPDTLPTQPRVNGEYTIV